MSQNINREDCISMVSQLRANTSTNAERSMAHFPRIRRLTYTLSEKVSVISRNSLPDIQYVCGICWRVYNFSYLALCLLGLSGDLQGYPGISVAPWVTTGLFRYASFSRSLQVLQNFEVV